MAAEYSVEACKQLIEAFDSQQLVRPMRIGRYEAGDELTYEVTGVAPAATATVRLAVERFVGGGFAGQVYRVKVLALMGEPIKGLAVGGAYAMKILIPPSKFSLKFRDLIYELGFQAPFSLQSNPDAARAGALWQKFIRRAAKIYFGSERAVVDILATFVEGRLGSAAEISEWIDGRNWQFEVDDHLDLRSRHFRRGDAPTEMLGSPEYRAKREFMADMVTLFHDMGAHELARQYEWSTCKSQPNVLKRTGDGDGPAAGLTAVDFRAGLALLPMLPMSPGDFRLIAKGLARGSLVQFDRGNLGQLESFVNAHQADFADMADALVELKAAEAAYRNSQPDITHNHVRLVSDGRLWRGILDGLVTGWRVRNIVDDGAAERLRSSRLLTIIFALLGAAATLSVIAGPVLLLIALFTGQLSLATCVVAAGLVLVAPGIIRAVRKLCGRGDYREHYGRMLGDIGYLARALRGHLAEKLLHWHRAGRISAEGATGMLSQSTAGLALRLALHSVLAILPAGMHRMLTDRRYAAEKLRYVFVRPIRLYFDHEAREQWLRDMVAEGQAKHMLTDEDAEQILSKIDEPFIQKYLKSLAVHVCTLPVTQVVSVTIAIIWWLTHPERPTAWAEGLAIIALFQFTPISPGSLVRGFYVLYLVIRERNFKDYNIAVFLGFFKYVGYLAFPIQMARRYPALARFMAGHWATEAVHFVPVFGEHGALLEHAVFDGCYNHPLTIRRKMGERSELRSTQKPRINHAIAVIAIAVAHFAAIDAMCIMRWGAAPTLKNIWPATLLLPLLAGAAATIWAGGLARPKRIVLAALCAIAIAVLSGAFSALQGWAGTSAPMTELLLGAAEAMPWRLFLLPVFAVIGAVVTEISLPAPSLEQPDPQ